MTYIGHRSLIESVSSRFNVDVNRCFDVGQCMRFRYLSHQRAAKALADLNICIDVRLSSCADPESFVRGGNNLTFFFVFLIEEGIDEPYATISGRSSARQRNAI